jgi:hypothetical protein
MPNAASQPLYDALITLPAARFEELIERLGVERAYLSAPSAPQATRASELLAVLRARPDGVEALGEALEAEAPAADAWRAPRQRFIADRTRDFVGRDYVFAAFDAFLARATPGYFVVQGHPGAGKSAILAEYARRTGCIAYFNQSTSSVATVGAFLEGFAAQVAARRGRPFVPPPSSAAKDGLYFERLLDRHAPAPGEASWVIAVDALDEVEMGATHRDNPLFLPRLLPERVVILVSTRPGARGEVPLSADVSIERFDLDAHPTESRRDVCEYIRRASARSPLRERIEASGLDAEAFVDDLATRSQNNFMYLRHVLPSLAHGADALSLDALPIGLAGYYERHWERMGMCAAPLPRTRIRVLYVLAEMPRPLSCELIASIVGEDPLTVQGVLTEWRPFLSVNRAARPTVYHLYHASFRDFLRRREVLSASGVTLEEVHRIIAADLSRGLPDDAV